jgi:hypothetical protein
MTEGFGSPITVTYAAVLWDRFRRASPVVKPFKMLIEMDGDRLVSRMLP